MTISHNKILGLLGKYGIIFLMAVLIIVFSLLSDSFLRASTFGNIVIANVATGILALGGFFILVTSEFDLSLGYNVMVTMAFGAWLKMAELPEPIVAIAMIVAGTAFGFLNGLMVVKLHISAYVATLASGLLMYGLAQILTGGSMLRLNLSESWQTFSQGKIGQLGYCVVFWFVLCTILYYVTNHTVFGRNLYAVGDNPKIAYLAGINTERTKLLAFLLAGFFTSLAAIVYMGQLVSASPQYGPSLLLPAYSMVFISSAAIKPGIFNIPGLVFAILFYAIGSSGITIVGAPTWVSYVFEGTILLIALLLFNTFRPKTHEEIESTG